ncbi:hypothetical protein BHU72_10930 [Desulfuribacillus stibiiarsenatis]|uniref:DUF2508 domain-containing protein n=1 Tax=Desulfuribacillus stibiiarsenatis TaxID=1390249 RepID=A0A1E5L2M6_9FIRM|nr:DUF2508 family protein [Desulfuribacillus stibiiarsenatis]OEH84311.1 hypothetical protein BHU72_10930 [Desulfuribacillus stibiiarsenatis]
MSLNELEKSKLYEELACAKEEWILAQKQYEYATEKDAIDAAIYKILATEKRYMFLLKQLES